jgi:RNA polymerase sigma-70 factor (ECF subfamily)
MELSLRERVRQGDPEAFGVLFDEHARAVYNHAFRLTGDWASAEDVVSLTFLAAWRRRGTVQPGPASDAGPASSQAGPASSEAGPASSEAGPASSEAGPASLRPWLLGIATNLARNASRAARRHRAA